MKTYRPTLQTFSQFTIGGRPDQAAFKGGEPEFVFESEEGID